MYKNHLIETLEGEKEGEGRRERGERAAKFSRGWCGGGMILTLYEADGWWWEMERVRDR